MSQNANWLIYKESIISRHSHRVHPHVGNFWSDNHVKDMLWSNK